MHEAFAGIALGETGGDLHECGFARAVTADEADAIAVLHAEVGAFEQRRAAERQADVFETEEL